MNPPLRLTLTDYASETRWRWQLTDGRGAFLADHEVDLGGDRSPEARAFADLPAELWRRSGTERPAETLARVGKWMGERVFGPVAVKLGELLTPPATVVEVSVPSEAQALLARPFELAHLPGPDGTGRPLAERGVRLVYHLAGSPPTGRPKPAGERLRVLALFSLPHGEQPLGLRRERVELEALLHRVAQTGGLGIELRALQYGATRAILGDALEEAAGWDLIHVSGHGLEGEVALEDEAGGADPIDASELALLLKPAQGRLSLLTLSTCLSGAASVEAARRQVGLEPPRRQAAAASALEAAEAPAPGAAEEGAAAADESPGDSSRQTFAEAVAVGVPQAAALPSLGQQLAAELDCAVLAMRYSVGDDFARRLTLALYDKLLAKRQPLPAALQLALGEALADASETAETLPLSAVTPILFGRRAAGLVLNAPAAPAAGAPFVLPLAGLLEFPPPAARFVGRLRPMLAASAALAPESPRRGVLFHGMAGGGKSACALELAWRHEQGRFTGMAWWKAPDEGHEIAGALTDFALALERQLPGLALVGLVDDPSDLKAKALPRLKALLRQNSLLLVLDNLESLLTSGDRFRDDRWAALILALLDHPGLSRVVLTSRRVPADLAVHSALERQAIHALSFPESVLLARELPALSRLFAKPDDHRILQRILAAAQGHPKLLELADALAGRDRPALEELLAAAGDEPGAFFTAGETDREVDDFLRQLTAWTTGVSATLPATARLLFHFLACLEEEDRTLPVVEANWKDFLTRLGTDHPASASTLAGPGQDLAPALDRLASAGLVEVERPLQEASVPQGDEAAAPPARLRLHPAVAAAGREEAEPAVPAAVDRELGDYYVAWFVRGMQTEMQGGGRLIAFAGVRAAPYLLRGERWEEAGGLLEQALARDATPATVAAALPLLQRLAAATEGTDRELDYAGVYAKSLLKAGRHAEAETRLRELIDRAEAQETWRLASGIVGDLVNLLRDAGRAEEALRLVERKAQFTRRAGLGPWTLLLDKVRRLQLLNALGRYDEVLAAVEDLRRRMAELPEQGEAEEAVNPWNVRETLLDTGRSAALKLGRWQAALDLSAEVLRAKLARSAGEVELAAARANDYGPLLRLGRLAEARRLLEACRRTFETAGQVARLGKVLSALADLEDAEGDPRGAARFEGAALRYRYQAGEPEDCAISHNNLSNYFERSSAPPTAILAHRLADALICFQTVSGTLAITLRNLARTPLPPTPPPFAEVATQVEEMDGVRFRELFARLPSRAPDGDAALAEVWRLVEAEREKRSAFAAGVDNLPDSILEAFRSGDPDKFQAALEALPPAGQQEVMERLAALARQAGVEPERTPGPDMEQILREFEPLLRGIAAVARGAGEARAGIEALLPELEANGWRLTAAAERIWTGERDAKALTAAVDQNSALLIRRVLELVEEGVGPVTPPERRGSV